MGSRERASLLLMAWMPLGGVAGRACLGCLLDHRLQERNASQRTLPGLLRTWSRLRWWRR